jgi:hypothetical protein
MELFIYRDRKYHWEIAFMKVIILKKEQEKGK